MTTRWPRSGNAVALVDFNRGGQVVANEMRHLGENGVVLVGSTEWVDGRGGTQPRFSNVEANLIHHLGLYTKQSCAILSAVACENTIQQNVLFHGPRALINVNDVSGAGSSSSTTSVLSHCHPTELATFCRDSVATRSLNRTCSSLPSWRPATVIVLLTQPFRSTRSLPQF